MINILLSIIIYLLISVSVSHLWSHSKIMGYIRRGIVNIPYIRTPLLCPECSSFWIGLAIAAFILNPFISILPFIIGILSAAVITYTICGILYKKSILTDD